MQIVRPRTKSGRARRVGPVFVDLLDNTRLVEPVGKTIDRGRDKGKVACRVYFDESNGKAPPVYHGQTKLNVKLFAVVVPYEEHTLTRSQRTGFLLKSAS
jgi:DNA primase